MKLHSSAGSVKVFNVSSSSYSRAVARKGGANEIGEGVWIQSRALVGGSWGLRPPESFEVLAYSKQKLNLIKIISY